MSYDIWLTAGLGGDERTDIGTLDWNYTSNVAPMWRLAMPDTDGLADLDGMAAGTAAEHVSRGIAAMEADPDTYRELEPENEWGNFDGQLEALRQLLAACEGSPRAKVAIWR